MDISKKKKIEFLLGLHISSHKMSPMPLTYTELFPEPEMLPCKRYGPAIVAFVQKQADALLDLADRAIWRQDLLTVMADTTMNATTRQWIWIRAAKGFRRQMDYIMMKAVVKNFKCQHEHMPTFEDIVGIGGGEFDDWSNFDSIIETYEENDWPSDFDNKDSVKKAAMQSFKTYVCDLYERACTDHVASRSGAYA